MNIFILDRHQGNNARYHVDRHVVKMTLEAAQLACTALHVYGLETPYKPTHKNHPCAEWARDSRQNFEWLCDYGIELYREYFFRYGRFHKSGPVLMWCMEQSYAIPRGELTDFAQAMPDEYKRPNAIDAYRAYYMGTKSHLAAWTKREKPWWFNPPLETPS